MKVLQMLPGFDVNYPGGITNYVRCLHSQLSQKNIDSLLLFSETPGDYPRELSADFFLPVSTFRRFSYLPAKSDKRDTSLINFLNDSNPDIIHIHTIYGLSERILEYIQTGPWKYVISFHDYYMVCPRVYLTDKQGTPCRKVDLEKCQSCISPFENINLVRLIAGKYDLPLPQTNNTQLRVRQERLRPFLERADRLLPVSTRVHEIFHQVYANGNYSTLTIGNESANNFHQKAPRERDTLKLIFLGTLNRHKGAELLLKISDRIENRAIKLFFAGRVDPTFEDQLRASKIENLGAYSPATLTTLLNDFDMGMALPIWEDNGPQVVMELLNNGLPVIGTAVGGIPDFVHHMKTGYLFHPDKETELNDLLSWMNNLSRKDVNDLFLNIQRQKGTEEHAKEILQIYSELAA